MSEHLNLRWTIADMDKIIRLAYMRMPLQSIAKELSATVDEISKVMERNGIKISGDRQW